MLFRITCTFLTLVSLAVSMGYPAGSFARGYSVFEAQSYEAFLGPYHRYGYFRTIEEACLRHREVALQQPDVSSMEWEFQVTKTDNASWDHTDIVMCNFKGRYVSGTEFLYKAYVDPSCGMGGSAAIDYLSAKNPLEGPLLCKCFLADHVADFEQNFCVPKPGNCPVGYIYNSSNKKCEAKCSKGTRWNQDLEACYPENKQEGCDTQSDAPIDFFNGNKYRDEHILSTGKNNSLSFSVYYDSQTGDEITPRGIVPNKGKAETVVSHQIDPIPDSEYGQNYDADGLRKSSSVYNPDQHYGQHGRYWRTDYDDVLLIFGNGNFSLRQPTGIEINFDSNGASSSYPFIQLQAVNLSGEISYVLYDRRKNNQKVFDSRGRLIRIVRGLQETVEIAYDSIGRMTRVTDKRGAFLEFTYREYAYYSPYAAEQSSVYYIETVANDRGEVAQLHWNHLVAGRTSAQRLLTTIRFPPVDGVTPSRSFRYRNRNSPLLSSISESDDINDPNRTTLLGSFGYDVDGTATFSQIYSKGFTEVIFIDANVRQVKNEMGKLATYTFAEIAGAKRLQKVSGEATHNCLKSEIEYVYDMRGNLEKSIKNGQVSEYTYDLLGREISRTEASGTPEARTITTEYHDTLNLPIKIIEPDFQTEFFYDAEGRLLITQKTATAQ